MSTYLILFATIAIIYYFLIHKKPARKTDSFQAAGPGTSALP